LIHPIAGRCKHCKGDLSVLRSSRPAAAASLPALLANGQGNIITQHQPPPNPYANGNGHAHANGHAAAYAPAPQAAVGGAATPMPVPMHDGSQPILPPRPTGRMYATSSAPATSWWKSWPLIVIVLAGLAIVTAVILMVLPPGGSSDKGVIKDKGSLAPPPAPERMDTNPLPPSQPAPPRAGDPWSNGGTQGKTDPLPKRSPDIDIPDDPDPGVGNPGGSLGGINGTGAMMMAMMGHACSRAASCGALDSTLKQYCELTKIPTGTPPTCAAAKRCLQHIDEVDCSTKFDDLSALQSVTYKFQDCVEAMSC
jgi:hypothetical protein